MYPLRLLSSITCSLRCRLAHSDTNSRPPEMKQGRQYHRRVCTCQVHDCISGQYIDANGQKCNGVELRPEAFEAHQRAELHHCVQAERNHPSTSLSSPSHDLLSRLEQVVLGPSRPSKPSEIVARSTASHHGPTFVATSSSPEVLQRQHMRLTHFPV